MWARKMPPRRLLCKNITADGRVTPGDVLGLVRLLQSLERDRSMVYEAGARARRAFEAYYDRPIGSKRILSILGLGDISAIGYRFRRCGINGMKIISEW